MASVIAVLVWFKVHFLKKPELIKTAESRKSNANYMFGDEILQ